MQKFTMKLWTAAGVAAAATIAAPAIAAGPPPVIPAASEFVYPDGFGKAVSLMLAGEGGENGIGVHKVWPTLMIPALTGAQVKAAIADNSLVIPYHYTFQFKADGSIGGYNIRYDEVAVKTCPKVEKPGDGLLLYEGVCSKQVNEPIAGNWKVDGDKLCLDLGWSSTKVNDCFTVFFVMDSVALVKADGSVWGKAHALKKGAAPDM